MIALEPLDMTLERALALAGQPGRCRPARIRIRWTRASNLMQALCPGLLAAVLLLSGCGGCKKDGDGDTSGPVGQTCQAYSPENGGKYLCPEGFFCKYLTEEAMLDANEVGKCEVMAKYEPCMTMTLCGSADYAPKCETVNETAYCDWLQTSLRCKCKKPGPFTPVEGEPDDGDVKTPTTTK